MIIRRSALMALESFPLKLRFKETFKALLDPKKIVRMEAARQLASLPMGELDKVRKKVLSNALNEYENVLLFTEERTESKLSLAQFYLSKGQKNKAEKSYQEALHLQSKFVPAYVNYSHFLEQEGRGEEAFELLQQGMKHVPNMAILYHALGLWYVQNKQKDKAITVLKQAVTLDPDNARFSYVYAVAIGESNPTDAIEVLEKVYRKHRGNMQLVSGLVYYTKQVREMKKSAMYEEKLKALEHFSVR